MLPVIYSASSTEFSSNGQGVLIDCISCQVTEERNGIFEMALTYPEHGQHADKLVADAIIKATAHKGDEGQLFRIYSINKDLAGNIECQCQHISYQLSFIPCAPFTASGITQTLQRLRQNMQTQDDGFTFTTNKTTSSAFKIEVPASTKSVLGGMEGSILDTFGGEFEFNNKVVKLWNSRGHDNNVILRYGKNITDIEQECNIAETYTGLRPYYYDEDEFIELATSDKCVWCDNANSFPYKRVLVYDATSEFEELTDSYGDKIAPTQSDLMTFAQKYINTHDFGVPKVSVEVDFEALWDTPEYSEIANLETVNLCDTVHVLFDAYDISVKAKVVKTVYDSLLDRYQSITVGSAVASFTDSVASIPEKTSSMIAEESTKLERAQQRATNTLLGLNGGYKVEKRNGNGQIIETLYMDTLDEGTATKIWRWNINGLGYSPNGASGPYTVAITKNGEIVGDFITTGTLDANKVDVVNLKAQNVYINSSSTVKDKFSAVDTTLTSYNTRITANATGLSSTVTRVTSLENRSHNLIRNSGSFKGWYKHESCSIGTWKDSSSSNAVTYVKFSDWDSAIWRYTASFTPNTDPGDDPLLIPYSALKGRELTLSWTVKLATNTSGTIDGTSDNRFCFSFYIRNKGSISSQKWRLIRTTPASGETITTALKRFSTTFTMNDAFFTEGDGVIDANLSYVAVGIYDRSVHGAWVTQPQLEYGSVATVYTPNDEDNRDEISYSKITQTADKIETEVVSRKASTPVVNMLPSIYYRELASGNTWTFNGITFKVNADGSITANGTATDLSQFYINNFTGSIGPIRLDPTKKYRLHGAPSGASSTTWRLGGRFYTATQDPTNTSGGSYYADYGSGVTIPTGFTYAVIYAVRVDPGVTISNKTFYPMLEVGEEDHAYVSTHNGTYGMNTSYNSRITQNADQITALVTRTNTLEQRGGNLLRNAGTLTSWDKNSTCTTGTAGGTAVGGNTYASFRALTSSESVSWRAIHSPRLDMGIPYAQIRNKTITVSFYSASTQASSITGEAKNYLRLYIALHHKGNTKRTKYSVASDVLSCNNTSNPLTTGWKRFSRTLNVTDSLFSNWDSSEWDSEPAIYDSDVCYITFYDYSPYQAYFCCPQVELGSVATKWAPMIGDTSIAKAEASIQINADAISTKVSSTDFNGNTIASKINQTATTIAIEASKINLNGAVTANNNVKIGTDGKITAVNADITGKITATSGSFTGSVTASSGTIGGWSITGSQLSNSRKIGDITYKPYLQALTSPSLTNAAFAIQATDAEGNNTWPFEVMYDGTLVSTKIRASGGTIANWGIGSTEIGKTYTESSGTNRTQHRALMASPSSYNSGNVAFSVRYRESTDSGATYGSWTNNFYVTYGGKLYAKNADITGKITATSGSFTGSIEASSGQIGRYKISSTYLYTGEGSTEAGMGGNQAFWAGASASNSAPFRVAYDGTLVATNATITGSITATSGTIGGCTISDGTLTIANANISSLNGSKLTGTVAEARIDSALLRTSNLGTAIANLNLLNFTSLNQTNSNGTVTIKGQFDVSGATLGIRAYSTASQLTDKIPKWYFISEDHTTLTKLRQALEGKWFLIGT